MKKIKLFLCVALFGAMSFGAFSAYDYYTMSAEEKALLENIEALTSGENPGGGGTGFDEPTGRAYIHKCGASLGFWEGSCLVTVTDCQGGGNGCNVYRCPTHASPTN